jgi:preprotein translocase subunit SecB
MPTKKRTKLADNAYERFVREVEVCAMGLTSSSCQVERRAYAELRKDKQNPVRKITVSYELEDVEPNFFDSLARYTLTAQDRKGRSKPLVIECTFQAHFHGPERIDREFAERFVKSFLGIIAWPYFRQFVFDSTARMAIPPITLPLLPEP